jgi:hypothetical protein
MSVSLRRITQVKSVFKRFENWMRTRKLVLDKHFQHLGGDRTSLVTNSVVLIACSNNTEVHVEQWVHMIQFRANAEEL